MQTEYKELSEKAMKLMISFAKSYFCETRISAVAMIKSKCQSQINVDCVMNVAILIKSTFENCSPKGAYPH
jgi:hypothetical protein